MVLSIVFKLRYFGLCFRQITHTDTIITIRRIYFRSVCHYAHTYSPLFITLFCFFPNHFLSLFLNVIPNSFTMSILMCIALPEYVNIDDCWQVSRAANNSIVPDPVRFPSGLLSISRKLHSQNLKFGIYTAAHQFTCQHRPGSWQMESIDSQSYCDFEIDYLKVSVSC